jgi:hypothetical protein
MLTSWVEASIVNWVVITFSQVPILTILASLYVCDPVHDRDTLPFKLVNDNVAHFYWSTLVEQQDVSSLH